MAKNDGSAETRVKFSGRMRMRGINPYVLVEGGLAQRLKKDWRKPMPVLVRINGMPREAWRINMMPTGDGDFYLYLHERVRVASGTKVGDVVRVEVRFDGAYRNGPMHGMPGWFEEALRGAPGARAAWEALAPSRQKEVLRYFAGLKSEAARVRNLAKVMAALSGEKTRFMARTWEKGK